MMISVGLLSGRTPRDSVSASSAMELALEEAVAAERAGFDSIVFSEHHQQDADHLPTPLINAVAAAARTTRIRVGSCVILLPLHDAIDVAETVAMLDVISNGRAILGVGLGYAPEDLTLFNRHPQSLRVRMEEALTILTNIWRDETYSFSGKAYNLENVRLRPRPVQLPHPPIWCGGLVDAALDRCARFGEAWIATSATSIDEVADVAGRYRKACAKYGTTPRIVVPRDAWVTDGADVPAEVRQAMFDTHESYARMGRWDDVLAGRRWDELPFEELVADRMIVGNADHCVSEIGRWHERIGADYFLVRLSHARSPSRELALGAIERFGSDVIPRLAG